MSDVTRIPISYRPGERPECFDHAKAVLLTLAGNRPGPGTVAYTSAKTEVIEDAMVEMEPMEGLRQLLEVKQESHEYARSPRQ
jgi:hypothetical protein